MRNFFLPIILLSITLIILVSCGNNSNNSSEKLNPSEYKTTNNLEDVTMKVDEQTISPEGLTVIFENNSDKDCIYGDPFTLEKIVDGKWFEVPIELEDNYGFNDIGYELPPDSSSELDIDWEWLYGNLDASNYRIIKEVLDFREPGDFDEYHLSAE